MNHNQMRQGDVWIARVENSAPPADATLVPRDNGRVVLAYGEVTGHAHAILDPEVTFRTAPDGTLWLSVEGDAPAALVHEEHATVTLAPGHYIVRHQKEWTDDDEPLRVAD